MKKTNKRIVKTSHFRNRTIAILVILLIGVAGTYFISRGNAASSDTTVFKTTDNYCYRIPAIVRDSAGKLYAFAERRKTSCTDNGDFDISMKTKSANGSWSSEKIIVNRSTDRVSNPVPIIKDDVIYLIYTYKDNRADRTKAMYLITSSNGGKSWTDSTVVMQTNTLSGPGHGLALPGGRLIFASGRGGIYSDDNGKSWNWGYKLSEQEATEYIEGSIAHLESNRLLICYKVKNEGYKRNHRCAISEDNGITMGRLEADKYNTPLTVSVYANLLRPAGYRHVFYSMPTDPTYRKGIGIYASEISQSSTPIQWNINKPFILTERNTRSAYSDMVHNGKNIGILYETGNQSTYERIVYTEKSIKLLIDSTK